MIQAASEDGQVGRNDRYSEFRAMLPGEQFVGAGLGRRKQNAGRGIWRVLQTFICSVNANQRLGFVIIRSQIFVIDRPVDSRAIPAAGFEIVRAHSQGDAPPVIGAATEHTRTPPHEVFVLVAAVVPFAVVFGERPDPVRLFGHFPPTINRGVEKPERLVGSGERAQWRLVRCMEHRSLPDGVIIPTCFEHKDFGAFHRQNIC